MRRVLDGTSAQHTPAKFVICKETSETSTTSSFWVHPITDIPATRPTLVIWLVNVTAAVATLVV